MFQRTKVSRGRKKKKREKKKEREARFARTVHLSVNRWPLGVLPGR